MVKASSCNNALFKLDCLNGKVAAVWREEGGTTGESLFVPNPDGVEEDDGVVLAYASAADGAASVVVLDAKSFELVARVLMPSEVHMLTHWSFVPQ